MLERYRGSDVFLKITTCALLLGAVLPAATVYAAFGDGTPTVANPSVFTLQDSKGKVEGATGAFTQHISIDIPPGRNGLQPDLALDYNSQNPEDGIVGYGWSLSIPYIQRLNKTGTNELYGNNPYYSSSIDGELATTTASTTLYRARVDDGSFRSYSFSENTWIVYDKNGTRYLYGATSTTRQSATTSPTQVYKWMIEEIRDTNDNYIKFSYIKDGNQVYPYQITYTGNGSTDGPATITFATSTRTDVLTSYKPSFKVTTSYRISQITASFNGTMVRQYALSYTTGVNGYRSLLSSIQETGRNDTAVDITLPAMSFSYVNNTNSLFSTPSSSTMSVSGQSFVVNDTNGNGVNDVNKFYFNTSSNATGSSMYIDQGSVVNTVVPPEWWANTPDPPTPQERGVRYVDVNGDGKADVPRGIWNDVTSTSTRKLYDNVYATSTGYAWVEATTTPISENASFTNPAAYWKLDESSGVAADSATGNNVLTNNNSTAYTTGKINNGANFVASSSNYLSITDAGQVNLDPTSKFSCAGWVKFSALPGTGEAVFCAKNSYNDNRSFTVQLGSVGQSGQPNGIYVIYSTTGSLSNYGEFDSTSGLFTATSTWYHVAVAVDAPNGTVHAWVNGAPVTVTNRSGSDTSIYDGNAKFSIGALDSETSGVVKKLDGMLDEFGFWKGYILTQSDVNNLYNGGSGNTYPFATTTPVTIGTIPYFQWQGPGSPSKVTTGLFGDVNGDGFPDYALSLDSHLNGLPSNGTYLGNGSGWDSSTSTIFVAPKQLPATTPTITNSMLADINGDGLDDWIYSDATTTQTRVLLNTGTSWESSADTRWDIATTTLKDTGGNVYVDRGMRFMDINGDKLADFIRSYSVTGSGGCSTEVGTAKIVFLNTGSGWATSTTHTLPAYVTSGDGSAAACTYNEYANFLGNGQMEQDVISSVTYPKGGSTGITYGLTTRLGGNPQLPYALLVVTNLVNHNGSGSNEETAFSFGGGLQYFPANTVDRKFAGFATTTEARSDRTTTTYYNQGDSVFASAGEQTDGYGQINHPYRTDVFTLSGVLQKRTYNRWNTVTHGNSTFVGLGRQLEQTYASDGTHRDTATEYLYSSTNGDLIEIDQYGGK